VINNLAEQQSFVNFRDSKLTMLLKHSLEGNCKTTLICTVDNHEDTVSTLRFAQRAKKIETRAVKNVALSKRDLERIVQDLTEEN
jgi:hypothetical protein